MKKLGLSGLGALGLVLASYGCGGSGGSEDPYSHWPDPQTVFPYIYTPQTDLLDWERVRFETETWDPESDWDEISDYLQKAQNHRKSAPRESLQHFEAMRSQIPRLAAGDRLAFVGDILWVAENRASFALGAAGLMDAELRIGNLETPTSPNHPTEPDWLSGAPRLNMPPEILDGLPLDVLQLNNNHSLDMGDEGLEATLAQVDARDFVRTGVDSHARVELDGLSYAFLSFTWGLNRRDITSTHELFVVPFGHEGPPIDLSPVTEAVAQARAQVDTVVVLLHWGYEYEYYPDPQFMVQARQIIAAGADLIVGQGSHVVQPVEVCQVNRPEQVPGLGSCSVRDESGIARTAAVIYSLGNFSTFQQSPGCRAGLVATVSLDPDVTGLGWAASWMGFDPENKVMPLDEALDDPEAAEQAQRLDLHLGTGWRR